MSTVIGSNGNMAGINWRSGGKFLQVEVDPTGGANFIDMGTTQLMNVPYALYAERSGNSSSAGATGPTVDAPKTEGDFYGFRYAEFTVPLVKAVQELNVRNEQQQQLINELLKRIEALEKSK